MAQDEAAARRAAVRGRGALSNESGRFERERREAFDDGWDLDGGDLDGWDLDGGDLEDDAAPRRPTETALERPRRIITRNASPDVPFDRSINPYRGCEHGCVYCFARPTHAFLGLSPGLDFETKLTAKPEAAALLRRELAQERYRPRPIAIGTNTDPYQPIEREQGIMRSILEVLAEHRHPVTIVTKGAMILRDLDILGAMAKDDLVRVGISLTTLDRRLARAMEPRAATPARRLAAIAGLASAGVPVGAMIAPVIPGLNDAEIEAILSAAQRSGADWADYVALRLPLEVSGLFQEWLAERYPDRAAKVMRHVREMHGGQDYDPEWGRRLRGTGVVAQLIARRFAAARNRLGLAPKREGGLRCDLFRRPSGAQLSLSF